MAGAVFRSQGLIRRILLGLLGSTLLLNLTGLLLQFLAYKRIRLLTVLKFAEGTLETIVILFNNVVALQHAFFFASIIVFLIWFYRAYRNLIAFRIPDLKYSPKWTILGYLIPIMNLFRPLQVMEEIWRASDPEKEYNPNYSIWNKGGRTTFIQNWWLLHIISGVLAGAIARLVPADLPESISIEQRLRVIRIAMIYHVISTFLLVSTIVVVYSVSARQIQKAVRLWGRGK